MSGSPWTPVVQVIIAFSALCVAGAALTTAAVVYSSDRNAHLVEIGVAVLRADPKKDASAASAREWALDLIDANAGGTKFSPEARRELMGQALALKPGYRTGWYDTFDTYTPDVNGKNSN